MMEGEVRPDETELARNGPLYQILKSEPHKGLRGHEAV